MQKRSERLYWLTAAALAAALFALFRIFPLTGDDWFREGLGASLHSAGDLARTVAQKWSTTNGRILGNVLAYSAGSRPLLRDLLRTAITLALAALLARVTNHRSAAGLALCAALVLALPREMFREIYPWAAGYFNYVPPVALSLGALALMQWLFTDQDVRGGKARCAVLFLTGFAAQLFIENVTFYVLCSAGIVNLWQLVCRRRLSAPLMWYLFGAVLGAALLLASPSYLDILLRGEGYQVSAVGGLAGLIESARKNQETVFRYLLADCPLLYGSVTLLLGARLFRTRRFGAVDLALFGLLLGCCAALFFGTWTVNGTSGLCLAWFVLAAAAVVRWTEGAWAMPLYFLLAALCAAFPLLFVSPIGPRCLYASYVFLLAAALSLLEEKALSAVWTRAACVLTCAAVLAFYASVYLPLHRTDVAQRKTIEEAMARGEQTVTVPAYSDHRWLWEPDTPKMQYAYYYKVPGDLTIEFASTGEAQG